MADLPSRREPDPEQENAEQEKPIRPDRRMFERFLSQQAQDLEVRQQEAAIRLEELTLRRQESTQSFEFAQKSLTIQEADQKEVRKQEKRDSWQAFVIVLSVILVVGGIIVYAVGLNKDQFVIELARVILTALGGGGVGYVIGHRKGTKKSDTENGEE